MQDHDYDATQIKSSGWRQGSVLPPALVDQLRRQSYLRSLSGDCEVFVVVSHDCDVTNANLELEPEVELLGAAVLPETDKNGNYLWGKNPRTYQLEAGSPDNREIWQFSIHDRVRIPRRFLLGHGPDATRSLDQENVRRLALWLARRYYRAALPDAFVERTRVAVDRLRDQFKKKGDVLTAIYILVVDEELHDETPYEIVIWASMRAEDYENPNAQAEAQSLLDKVEAVLQELDGVDVKESELKSEAQISLDDLRGLKRWDFDDLTIRGQPTSKLPPEA